MHISEKNIFNHLSFKKYKTFNHIVNFCLHDQFFSKLIAHFVKLRRNQLQVFNCHHGSRNLLVS